MNNKNKIRNLKEKTTISIIRKNNEEKEKTKKSKVKRNE